LKKKVLITGGAGFIGHHIIDHILNKTNWEITSLDRLDYSGNLNRISDMMSFFNKEKKKRLRVVHHDLRAEINQMIRADLGDFNHVLHLAASSHVDRSIEDPMSFVLDNVVATCNILNFSKKLKNLKILFTFRLMKYLDLLQKV
jgi:dTDP-glucose 4,6-dehydratase